jgi:hypothetical protein
MLEGDRAGTMLAVGVLDGMIRLHAWGPGRTARRMCIEPLLWGEDGPRVLGPSFTQTQLPRAAE